MEMEAMEIDVPVLHGTMNPDSEQKVQEREFKFSTLEHYEIVRRLQRREKESELFEGLNVLTNEKCTIKTVSLQRTHTKIVREIKVLQHLNGCKGIIKLLDLVAEPITGQVSLILEHVEEE